MSEERAPYMMPINRKFIIPLAVGIDADISRSGWAIWQRGNRRHAAITALPIWELLSEINGLAAGQAEFYVDAGWLNEGYHHYAQLPPDFQTWSEKSKLAYMVKCGIQVGRNFGVGQVIVAYLRAMSHVVHEVRPETQKWSAGDLKQYTGWTGRTNSEARDAAKLCFQR